MVPWHTEIEAKLPADGVTFDAFKIFVAKSGLKQIRHKYVISPDSYWESGANVIRYRHEPKGNMHELTTKKRRSDISTRDRLEIDLKLTESTKPEQVEAFLEQNGFTNVFTLVKEADVFWVNLTYNVQASLVIYAVWREEEPLKRNTYIECEIEKGSEVTVETAKRHLRQLVKTIQEEFKVGDPINDSLYEIYSQKKYAKI